MRSQREPTLAEAADRQALYEQAVQDAPGEIDLVLEAWQSLVQRPPCLLREDFCGTALNACEWVRRDPAHEAVGVDLDPAVLEWGRVHNLARLDAGALARIDLVQGDVLTVRHSDVDIVLATNFSYFLFLERADLLRYFKAVRQVLASDGLFFLDAYGGYDAPKVLQETRSCEGFTYIWDQVSFNPINSHVVCHIHFEFPDGSRLEKAFSYHWRLWTLPEIRELLQEAGFVRTMVYWEGTDPKTGKGDNNFKPSEVGDADPSWVCYVVATASV